MIPKSSQRANAADLAAHLLNAEDNELVEVMELEGTIADDLTGGLREMEASFLALTNGKNSFYHLQVSPAPGQRWNDDLTYEYLRRVKEGLSLEGQPYGLVRHIKLMPDGTAREHFHLVVSRLDLNECRAVQISFDHIKLQQITRAFARDHGLELPPGYFNYADRANQTYRQKSLYEKSLTDRGHPTREEHQAIITPLWEGRVSPEGFIKALDHHGYILAFGKRPVVVDAQGKEHSLARLIGLDEVKVRDIRTFLADHYNETDLPSVDDAKQQAQKLKAMIKDFRRAEANAEKLDTLKTGQSVRREELEAEIAAERERDQAQHTRLDWRFRDERNEHRRAFLAERAEIRQARAAAKPTGLAAFLGRVTGVSLIQHQLQKRQDRERQREHLEAKREIVQRQDREREELRMSHEMRALDAERRRRELGYREAQEIRSLERHLEKQARLSQRGIAASTPLPSPAPHLTLAPKGRPAVPAKAMTRFTGASHQDRAKKEEFHAPPASKIERKLSPAETAQQSRSESATPPAGEPGRGKKEETQAPVAEMRIHNVPTHEVSEADITRLRARQRRRSSTNHQELQPAFSEVAHSVLEPDRIPERGIASRGDMDTAAPSGKPISDSKREISAPNADLESSHGEPHRPQDLDMPRDDLIYERER